MPADGNRRLSPLATCSELGPIPRPGHAARPPCGETAGRAGYGFRLRRVVRPCDCFGDGAATRGPRHRLAPAVRKRSSSAMQSAPTGWPLWPLSSTAAGERLARAFTREHWPTNDRGVPLLCRDKGAASCDTHRAGPSACSRQRAAQSAGHHVPRGSRERCDVSQPFELSRQIAHRSDKPAGGVDVYRGRPAAGMMHTVLDVARADELAQQPLRGARAPCSRRATRALTACCVLDTRASTEIHAASGPTCTCSRRSPSASLGD